MARTSHLSIRLNDRIKLVKSRPILLCPRDVSKAFRNINQLNRRVIIALTLTDTFSMMAWNIVGIGSCPNAQKLGIDCFRDALALGGSAVILVRNSLFSHAHPDIHDFELHEQLCRISKELQLPLLDFIILKGKTILSLNNNKANSPYTLFDD